MDTTCGHFRPGSIWLRLLVAGERRDQVGDGGAGDGVTPIGIDICKRQQDESALMRAAGEAGWDLQGQS